MGMAASQARYLALNARMNDIEYQGQQINQQRTTLSSQVNALYNSLLEMDVPTPPSTSDYTKIQYTGSLNASSFTIKNITPTSDGLYSVKLDYKESGNIVNKSYKTAKVVSTPASYKVSSAADNKEIKEIFNNPDTVEQKIGTFVTDENALDNLGDNKQVLLCVTKEDASSILSSYPTYIAYTEIGSSQILSPVTNISSVDEATSVYILCTAGDVQENGTLYSYAHDSGDSNDYANNVFEYSETTSPSPKEALSDSDKAELLGMNLLITDDNGKSVRLLTASDLNVSGSANLQTLLRKLQVQDKNGQEIPNANAGKTDYSIQDAEGNTIASLYTLTAAVDAGLITEDGYKEAMNSLRHSFSDLTDSEILQKFLVYIDKEGVPTFIKRDDLGKITDKNSTYVNYYQMGAGIYSTTKDYEGCKLEFDNQGRVTTIFIKDGDQTYSVKLEAETVTDSEAYEDAYNDYEYQKYLYDKKQQEINAKTSIIQSEDKNLELKLTRLDNERNAVNTELEAVKKVIDDDIDKSFKTFSG